MERYTTAPAADTASERTDVIVIGAGPAGLAVGACLRRAGVPFLLLEAGDRLGSSWHNHYERLHLHTVKRYSALPYLPFPRTTPRYPSRQQVIAYLEAYAQHFDIRPIFRQAVTTAILADGAWQVHTSNCAYRSRYLVICTGVNRQPVLPHWTGQEDYAGITLHSSHYRHGKPFAGKRVLVVGMGNSGAEIALDLHEHGADVTISVRDGVNVVPRDPLGVPIQVLSIVAPSARPHLTDALMQPLWRRILGDLRPFGLTPPPFGPAVSAVKLGKIPVIDVGTARRIRERQITVRGAIALFTRDGVRFADGREEPFDAVVLATGFRPGLETFLPDAAAVTDAGGYPLAHGRRTALPGLYFCGFHNVSTGLLREIGREALAIAGDIARQEGRVPSTPGPPQAPGATGAR